MIASPRSRRRVGFVVSHPIQYYAPLHQRLAARGDLDIKVFFTWHAGQAPVRDAGFGHDVAWDVPLTMGYDFELVPNRAPDPGTHHFSGLDNPSLARRVLDWGPDAVHVTGWAWRSHLAALRAFSREGVPTLFRGDSHLLDDPRRGPRWWLKRLLLRRVYRLPRAFLPVGRANRAYYEAFGVPRSKLFDCPHSIDVPRFAGADGEHERSAARWREELGIAEERIVLLFAGKFEARKQPLELMRCVGALENDRILLIMVGAGELAGDVQALAAARPGRFRVLPFQNQSRMPVVYRLADALVLPSAHGETWGLAVNESMASGRAAIVSDRVGSALDLVDPSCGRIFPAHDFGRLAALLCGELADRAVLRSMGRCASARARGFDLPVTEAALVRCIEACLPQ